MTNSEFNKKHGGLQHYGKEKSFFHKKLTKSEEEYPSTLHLRNYIYYEGLALWCEYIKDETADEYYTEKAAEVWHSLTKEQIKFLNSRKFIVKKEK